MAKVHITTTSFTAGELSPRALGRTDIERYAQGLKRCRNAHPVVQGGVKRRPGSMFVKAAASNTARMSVLVPFVAGRSAAWVLEFSNLQCRIFAPDGTDIGVTLTAPYSDTQLAELDWAQSDNTLYLFHPLWPVQRLQRLDGPAWVLSPAPFTQVPFAEVGFVGEVSLTLSASTVGAGRTATASGAVFVASDVGRAIIAGPGIGVVTAVASGTSATIEITRAFSGTSLPIGQWTLDSSPQTTCTASAKDPVGASITLTAGADAWRALDVGSLVRLNGGLVRITAYTSATQVSAVILRELSGTTAAPALAWSLERPIWSGRYGYPRTGTVYQQRLVCAGNLKFPRTVWGSRIGELLDFELWTNDSDAWAFTIDADDSAPIAWVSASTALLVMTEAGEFAMRGGIEKPITPTNVRVTPESNHGAAAVRPCTVNRETLFVQRAGRRVRALGYRDDFQGFASPDITALVDHLTRSGVLSVSYQQEPEQLVWAVRDDGLLLSCTFDRDQSPSVVAWAAHDLGGVVESVCSVPDGDRDVVWLIVRRVINASTVRYLERLDDTFTPLHPDDQPDDPLQWGATVDCGVVIDSDPATADVVAAHLPGAVVDVVADGAKQPRLTLDSSGEGTIPRAAKRMLVGLPFTSEMTLLTPEFGTDTGSAQGQAARTGEITIRLLDTIGGQVRNVHGDTSTIPVRRLGLDVLDVAPQPFTGPVSLTLSGWSRDSSEITILQPDPMPMHVLSVTRKHTVNGG